MHQVAEILIAAFIVLSGVFGLVGSYALIKLRDTMKRLHGPTKASTLGIGCALIASMGYTYFAKGHLSFHELLITLFLLMTAPITANFIAKVYIVRNLPKTDLPKPDAVYGWAIYDDPPAMSEKE